MADASRILADLRSRASAENRAGMARFGINAERALGIRVPELRKIARSLGKDHALAAALWKSGVHEARILATLVDDPVRVTEAQMDRWARDFDSWDVCDQACGNLFDKSPFAARKALAWSRRDEEFVKRAGLALMATFAWHAPADVPDATFAAFVPAIERAAADERNFVKKAASWALRQMGKRNAKLRKTALASARRLAKSESKAARWIARDVTRELAARERAPRALARRV